MPDEELLQQDAEAVGRAVELLAERFENVTVFVNRYDPGSDLTISTWQGRGNWHARHGQVREWLIRQDADVKSQ